MASIPFNDWIRTNRQPGESTREAISRYSQEQGVSRGGTEFLVDTYYDQIVEEERAKSLTQQPQQQLQL